MVDESFCCKASESRPDAEWSYGTVWLEFGCEVGREDGVEGGTWKIGIGNSVDDNGKVGDDVGMAMEWLPVLISRGIWPCGFADGKGFEGLV